jgi:hypothetical protein
MSKTLTIEFNDYISKAVFEEWLRDISNTEQLNHYFARMYSMGSPMPREGETIVTALQRHARETASIVKTMTVLIGRENKDKYGVEVHYDPKFLDQD